MLSDGEYAPLCVGVNVYAMVHASNASAECTCVVGPNVSICPSLCESEVFVVLCKPTCFKKKYMPDVSKVGL